jgi:hypothetical protein
MGITKYGKCKLERGCVADQPQLSKSGGADTSEKVVVGANHNFILQTGVEAAGFARRTTA